MGYYENPPIIERAKSGEMIAAGIEKFAAGIAGGIQNYAANIDKAKKEQEAALKKERDERNKIELKWNNVQSDWKKEQGKLGVKLDTKIYDIIRQRIREAAKSEIALLSETNPSKRQKLLDNISLANGYIDNTGETVKALGGEIAAYANSAGTYGQPGGYVINGIGDIVDKRMGAMNVLSGRIQDYEDSTYDIEDDGQGGFNVTTRWKKKGEENYNEYTFNSREYLTSGALSDNSFLIKVPDRNENIKQAKETFFDGKTIRPGYLFEDSETIDVPWKGRPMEMVGVRRLNMPAIKAAIDEKSNIEATGWVNGSKVPELRAFVDVTLGKDRGYFDREIAPLNPEEQKEAIKRILTENTLNTVTSQLQRTEEKDENGNTITVYWENRDAIVTPKKMLEGQETKKGRGGKGPTEAEKNYAYAVEAVNKVMKRGKGTLFGTQERQLRVQNGKPTLWQYDKSLGDYMQIPLSEDQVRQGIDGLAASIGVYDRKRNKPFLPTKAKKKSNKKVELP